MGTRKNHLGNRLAEAVLTSTTIYVLSRNMKKDYNFYLKTFSFWWWKFSIYLNRRIFVMGTKTLKSYEISHFISFNWGDNLGFIRLGGIFKRICLDALNPNNERKNSIFPLTKSNYFLNILIFFQVLSNDKSLIYNDKNRGSYLPGERTMAAVTLARSFLYMYTFHLMRACEQR